MGKTLIINGADFSEVAIGHVELPRELSDTALAWIAASGNSGLTDDQKFAIDDFITAIGVNELGSVFSKIERLWLPMLSADKAHGLIDYKILDTHTLPSMSQTIFEDRVVFTNHGLKYVGTDSSSFVIDDALSVDMQNMSWMLLNTVQLPSVSAGDSKTIAGIGVSSVFTKYFFKVITKTQVQYRFNSSGSSVYIDSASDRLSASFSGLISNSNGVKILKPSGSIETTSAVEEAGTVIGVRVFAKNGNLSIEDGVPVGCWIIAKALTDDEATTLKNAVDTLFAAINV